MKLQVNGLKIAMVMVTAIAGVVLVNPSDATAAVRRTPIGIVVLSTHQPVPLAGAHALSLADFPPLPSKASAEW